VNPDLDLTLQRVIRAPRAAVWRAWTEPSQLEQWWVPAPAVARVDRLEARPGGAFVTRISEDGLEFGPHMDASFLLVDDGERLVFTNTVDSRWRPTRPDPIAMVGTDYQVGVCHDDPAARARHEELGFFDGWGSVTGQLTAFVEGAPFR